jgi:FkbM family methyltransferase
MLIKPFFYEPAKHLYKLLCDPEYLSWCVLDAKLGNVSRFKECKAKVHGWNMQLPDSASFLSSHKEIFVNKIYKFTFPSGKPKILDLGANIGLSILFFKTMYPDAQITAFEADPQIFRYLETNIHGNGFKDVELINKAIWNKNCTLKLYPDGADGGHVMDTSDGKPVEIEAIDIREVLRGRQFDFLKMDIEGAEGVVFPACKEYLSGFKYIFVEYHSNAGQKQRLDEILSIMSEKEFRISIHPVMFSPKPFTETLHASRFDLQLNIFAWKDVLDFDAH